MNIIGLLDRPDAGEYLFEGKNVENLDENGRSDFRLSKIGFVFQNFNLLSRFSALKNVILPLIYQEIGVNTRETRALEILRSVGMERWAEHKPVQLSGGQQQRVAIARALITNPGISDQGRFRLCNFYLI